MGKNQHSKDQMYITSTEWKKLYGGKKSDKSNSDFVPLPFYCCWLSLAPFEHPMCTTDGMVFDLMHIVPFLKKFGINPVTGEKLSAKSLLRLNYAKNEEGDYHCPVTYKVFTESTKIVAVRPTGNVFSWEAIDRLCIKPKNWKDLLNEEAFTRADIITLQDPLNYESRNAANFHHVVKGLKVKEATGVGMHNIRANAVTLGVMEELNNTYTTPQQSWVKSTSGEDKEDSNSADVGADNAAHYSTGAMAASLTSTIAGTVTTNHRAIIAEEKLLYDGINKKGYVQLNTSVGNINLELHCDIVPKTCHNFLLLCQRGYYDGTKFHRLIKNFMIQGGDPTGTGTGGESAWGGTFADEKPRHGRILSHDGRGILSMANAGSDTNRSQFFITFRSCPHLDKKHTIFGKVVGGMDVLTKLESISTNDDDRPVKQLSIKSAKVFIDPIEVRANDRAKARASKKEASTAVPDTRTYAQAAPKASASMEVGKYLNTATKIEASSITSDKRKYVDADTAASASIRKKKKGNVMRNFDSW